MGRVIQKEITIKNNKFTLEVYPRLEGTQDVTYEIFPENYNAALYAFSNKHELNIIIKEKHIYQPKKL